VNLTLVTRGLIIGCSVFGISILLRGTLRWIASKGNREELLKARYLMTYGILGVEISVLLFSFEEFASQGLNLEIVGGLAILVLSLILISMLIMTVYLFFSLKKGSIPLLKKYPGLSIVGIMKQKRAQQSEIALVFLSTFMGSYVILALIKWTEVNLTLLAVLIIISTMVLANKVIFEYRVSHGFYGKNKYEAAEIIKFILEESSAIDFYDNDKPKKVISDEDLVKIREEAQKQFSEGPAHI